MKWKYPRMVGLVALASGVVLAGAVFKSEGARLQAAPTLQGAPTATLTPAALQAGSTPLTLRLRDIPDHGLIVTPLNIRPTVSASLRRRVNWQRFQPIVALPNGTRVPAQWVPSTSFDGRTNFDGTLVLQWPKGAANKAQLRAAFGGAPPRTIRDKEQMLQTSNFTMFFDPLQTGGFPANIMFAKSGQIFEKFAWNDRLYDAKAGGYTLTNDRQAVLQVVSEGPICTVMRNRARYVANDGKAPDSHPYAIYDWYVFRKQPLVYVSAQAHQNTAYKWKEFHFLELAFQDQSFKSFAGGEPRRGGPFKADKSSTPLSNWGALINHDDAIGMFGGRTLIYDGRGSYGTYLHFAQPEPWQGWSNNDRRMSAWLWIGNAPEPAEAVRAAAQRFTQHARVTTLRSALDSRLNAMRAAAQKMPSRQRGFALWRVALLERRESAGEIDDITPANLQFPPNLSLFGAGDFGIALDKSADGCHIYSLFDMKAVQELSSFPAAPLFSLNLRNTRSGEERQLQAGQGWKDVRLTKNGAGFDVRWSSATEPDLEKIAVTVHATPDAKSSAWRWSLQVDNPTTEWTLSSIVFPEARVADLGEKPQVFFPRGPGEVQSGVWQRGFSWDGGTYPNGWCSMQFMAAYRGGASPTGLYLATHDPTASTKKLRLTSDAVQHEVQLTYEQLPEGIGTAGNDFTLPGQAVWQLMRGDWFDAATIYKTWVKREAGWWPKLGPNGRVDTPQWMRDLSAWSLLSGDRNAVVPQAIELSKFLGVPTGAHWYNWHAIPFDNDYPHYFPTTPGFTEGVREAQNANVFIMPYINGRLWDSRDKGAEDWQFTSQALPWTTKEWKDGKLEPHLESYSSKETDGSPVKLAAMCPATTFWQDKVREIVLRLQKEEGVKGVYIDQIGAAAPVLCMDSTHGHPTGGGHWWVDGYGRMLAQIRAAKPADTILTTECNAEPYIKYMDGYLTWHWQYDGQVPAFPAVYGGAIQMFSRAYRGGSSKNLALRMKVGQQLTFGEQIGWLGTNYLMKEIDEPSRDFFKRIVAVRHHFRRYFYAGEMARPPKISGRRATVTADWQWSGNWPVTTDAVMTGAWRLPTERKLILIFTNVSDGGTHDFFYRFDPRLYGITDVTKLKLSILTDKNLAGAPTAQLFSSYAPRALQRLNIEPRQTQIWELSW